MTYTIHSNQKLLQNIIIQLKFTIQLCSFEYKWVNQYRKEEMWYDCPWDSYAKHVNLKLVALRPVIIDTCPHPATDCKRLQNIQSVKYLVYSEFKQSLKLVGMKNCIMIYCYNTTVSWYVLIPTDFSFLAFYSFTF